MRLRKQNADGLAARSQDHVLGLADVLRTGLEQEKHQSCYFRQHGEFSFSSSDHDHLANRACS